MKRAALRKKMATLGKSLLFLFYPPKCAVCGKMGYEGLCPDCRDKVQEAYDPRKFLASGGNGFADAMYALFYYRSSSVKKLLFAWKLEDYRDLTLIFEPYIAKFLKKDLLPDKIHCVTYLPRRKQMQKKTGFDQAERIAQIVGRQMGLPVEPLLRRQGFSIAQHKAKFTNREKNVRGVFRATRSFQGETVLLIDDIVTTGASAREGARILKKAGAMKVYVLSLAH